MVSAVSWTIANTLLPALSTNLVTAPRNQVMGVDGFVASTSQDGADNDIATKIKSLDSKDPNVLEDTLRLISLYYDRSYSIGTSTFHQISKSESAQIARL